MTRPDYLMTRSHKPSFPIVFFNESQEVHQDVRLKEHQRRNEMDLQSKGTEKSVFVAGATGVLGRRVVPQLVKVGYKVTAIGRSEEKRSQLARMGARPVELDLFDAAAVRRAVAGQEVVINLATSVPLNLRSFLPGAWRMTSRIRREGSANLVEAALAGGASRYIQESFAPIYPDRGDQWIDESTPAKAARYNRAVLDAEASAQRFTAHGQTGIALRFAYLYGPDSPMTLETIRYVQRGLAPVFGSPQAYFPSLSHDDAAAAVVAALGLPAGIYNVSDDEPLRRREYIDSLDKALGVPAPKLVPGWIVKFLGSLGDTLARSQRISNRKLKAASGWTPRYPSMREGWQAVLDEMETENPLHAVKSAS
jgi:nucleoside-diphosphate-sugar epimerase